MPGWSVLVPPWKLAVVDSWYRGLSYGMNGPSRLALLSNLEYTTCKVSHVHMYRHVDILDNVTYTVERFPDRCSTIFLNNPRNVIGTGIADQILRI